MAQALVSFDGRFSSPNFDRLVATAMQLRGLSGRALALEGSRFLVQPCTNAARGGMHKRRCTALLNNLLARSF